MFLLNVFTVNFLSSWQPYMRAFFYTAGFNQNVTFTVVTNLDTSHESFQRNIGLPLAPNIRLLHTSRQELWRKLNRTSGLDVVMDENWSAYKFCDYKPLFGRLFQEELDGYTHWGWCDMDVIWGNIMEEYTRGYNDEDFISYSAEGRRINGPFQVGRNVDRVLDMYKVVPLSLYKKRIQRSKYAGLDEVVFNTYVKRNATFFRQFFECIGGYIWIWYQGRMASHSATCALVHYGGGGNILSALKKRLLTSIMDSFANKIALNSSYTLQNVGFGVVMVPHKKERIFHFSVDESNNRVDVLYDYCDAPFVKKYASRHIKVVLNHWWDLSLSSLS